MTHKVAIIGAGPAGYTAAIYTARATLSPVLFEGTQPGGQLTITTDIENYPGYPEPLSGTEMMGYFQQQAQRFGTEIISDTIVKADLSHRPFTLTDSMGAEHFAESVIIASGASARWMNIESETALLGHGVSACATCDGFFFRGKEVMVVGGGDTAMEEATFLTRFATNVVVVHRRDSLRASKIMQQRALDNPKIEFEWNAVIEEIHDVSAGKVTGVTLRNTLTGELRQRSIDGVFLAIGHKPNTEIFVGQLDLNDERYIVTRPGSSYTSVPGVFAAGDVQDHIYRQAITAAGTGCMAAIDAERWLMEQS